MTATSRLEDILLRSRESNTGIRHTLFSFLDDGLSLLRMRSVSRPLRDLISHHQDRIFRDLYVQSRLLSSMQANTFNIIAGYCQHLTITISPQSWCSKWSELLHSYDNLFGSESWQKKLDGEQRSQHEQPPSRSDQSYPLTGQPSPASVPMSPAHKLKRQDAIRRWSGILSQLVRLRSLTLRIYGNRDWPGFTDVEEELTNIRAGIERAGFLKMRELRLMPVHAIGTLHLQWSTLHAFGEITDSGFDLWQRLEDLELRMYKPLRLTDSQATMFKKQLYTYLASFAPTLRRLCLIWLGGHGLSPLALHCEGGLENRQPIMWTRLEELWLGNVAHLHRTIRLIPELMPKFSLAMTLRDDQDPLAVEMGDDTAWVSILLDSRKEAAKANHAVDSGSSTRSEQSSARKEGSSSGISSTSMLLPIVLDIK